MSRGALVATGVPEVSPRSFRLEQAPAADAGAPCPPLRGRVSADVVYFPGDAVHGARNCGTVTCRVVWVFPTDTYEEIECFDD